MTRSHCALFVCVILSTTASKIIATEPNWAGEYANKNFLDGQALFEMSIQQSGDAIQISFDAAYNDGHGAAPDGEGQAKIADKNLLQFKWEDSFKNAGTGAITRSGKDVIVSMKTMRAVDSRCLAFYGHKMRLKRMK